MFPRFPRRSRFGPTQSQRQKRFARLRRLSLALLLSALPVTGAGGGEAGTGALTDHVALELGECGKDVKRELAGGCCRVDGFLEGP